MSEKRKDSKGRILKNGESQRKDGRYQYRYNDIHGVRRTIYATDLRELRAKEAEIEQQLLNGVSYFDGKIQLSELLDNLFAVKQSWRESTRRSMGYVLNVIKESKLYRMQINKIKSLDCKTYLVGLHDQGYSYGSITTIHTILKMAFELACEDDVLAKNPCNFKLKSVVNDDTPKVMALSSEQEDELLNFLRKDSQGQKRYDIVVVLLGTGMRISEFGALTIKDIDFNRNVIHVRKQIVRLVGKIAITDTKSKHGDREIPMTKSVRRSIRNLMNARRFIKADVMIDGYAGFLCVTRTGRPQTASEYADIIRPLIKRYNEKAKNKIPRCTPHVFRHTFCTKSIAAGMDVKTVQYLMGHSDASTTLNVYTDAVFDNVVAGIELLETGTA